MFEGETQLRRVGDGATLAPLHGGRMFEGETQLWRVGVMVRHLAAGQHL